MSLALIRATDLSTSPDRNPAADGAVERLRRAFDALGGCVEGIGDRGLGLLGAIDGGDADVAHAAQFLFEVADARMRIEQFVAGGECGHDGQTLVADLAELAAQLLDARLQALGELEQPHLLPLLAGHAVLPAVDGDVDVAHSSSSSGSSSCGPSASAAASPSECSSSSASAWRSAPPSTSRMAPIA